MEHLGEGKYSVFFPFFATLAMAVFSEVFALGLLHNPNIVGTYIIFVSASLAIYFAFRDGIRGGFVSSSVTIAYFLYIIFTRGYSGDQLDSAIETTFALSALYYFLAGVIGWLKQSIDQLIEKESDGRRRLETIISQLPVGVIITDSKGRVTKRNQKVDEILGIQIPLGFTIGKDSLSDEKINGKPVNPSQSPLFQALKTGKPIIGREMEFERKDGKKVSLQVSSAPIHNKSHAIIAAASIISDVTRQKELERQKDQFLGIASHELKTPVTSIKAYGQVLQTVFSRKGDQHAVVQLAKMDAQINKLTNLIGDLLDVTKIQQGRLEFHEADFDFNSLVKEIVAELQITTEKHTIVSKLDNSVLIHADRERVGQVITNLLSNAIKYSPEGTKILVSSKITDKVTLCVQDFGIGIPKEKQGKVFEQFFRVSGTDQNTYPGLGLGLFISSEIIKREGGKIWVQSGDAGGSQFFFTLPVQSERKHSKKRSTL